MITSLHGYLQSRDIDVKLLLHCLPVCYNFAWMLDNFHDVKYSFQSNVSIFHPYSTMIKLMQDNVVLFLHGFLGTGEDWITAMKAISGSARCISIDLPSHGGSKIQYHGAKDSAQDPTFSIEVVANILYKMIDQITPVKVICVGYSMGARIALHMALRFSDKVNC